MHGTMSLKSAILVYLVMVSYFVPNVTQLLTFSKCQVTVTATLELWEWGAERSQKVAGGVWKSAWE